MTTETLPELVPVTKPGDGRETWLAGRGTRVTASIAHEVANGGRATWQRILADMLNGSRFKGTASTKRGNAREPFLIDWAREFVDDTIRPNDVHFVHPENDQHGATPDGLGDTCGVEVKSRDFGASVDKVPAEHYDQSQFGMYVTGRRRWLYVSEVMGEDGEPTLDDPTVVWIERDERRIAQLVREADRFIAWREDGAPAADDIAPELDDALARFADARSRKSTAEADEKAANAAIRAHIAATPGAESDGLKLAGRRAHFVYSVSVDDVLDEEAWEKAEPESHAAWRNAQESVNKVASTALALYKKPARSTRLNITPTKDNA